MENDKVAWKN